MTKRKEDKIEWGGGRWEKGRAEEWERMGKVHSTSKHGLIPTQTLRPPRLLSQYEGAFCLLHISVSGRAL